MMRRIDLLPQGYVEQRRERRTTVSVVVAGLLLLTLLIGYWVMLAVRIGNEEDRLSQVQARNQQLQAQIDDLQRYAEMDAEVKSRTASLATVMAGDVDWPGVFAQIAMVIPGDVWLTNLTASAGQTEGATQVGTETAPVRVSDEEAFGRMQFQGKSLSMPGVAKWLVRLGTVKEFNALWLNNATEGEESGGTKTLTFDTTLELDSRSASDRFQRAAP